MRTWIKDPLAIFAEGAERGIIFEGTRIMARVGRGAEPERVEAVFDASRHVVLPGLVNTHHHFYQTLTRAHPQAINKALFPWLIALYPIWARLRPNHLRLAARLALTELLMSGCTTAADHHYLYPAGLEHAVDIEVEEALRLGMRITVSRGSMNLSAKDGGLPPDAVVQSEETILADSERVLKLFHDPKPGARVRVALAPCSPFSISKPLMSESARLAERYDCRLHTHLCETDDEERFCLEMYGLRPVDLLEETGWLSNRVWLAHGIHFNAGEIARLGKAGVGVSHCAASNMVLASGICPTCDLEASGAPVGLGVDGSASNDSSNMMEAVRHALMIGRLRYGAERVIPSRCPSLGDRGLGALPRPRRHRQDRRGPRGGPGAVHPRRSPLFRRARSAGRPRALRRPSRRPGDDRRRVAGDRRAAGGHGPRGADRRAQRGRA